MDITGMLAPDRVVKLKAKEKEAALVELAGVLARCPLIPDGAELTRAILDREEILSTGIGQEFAVPHAKLASIKHFVIGIGASPEGMEYGSLDKMPVRVVVMIACPDFEQNTYLKVLKKVTEVLKVKSNRARVLELVDKKDMQGVIDMFRE